MRPRLPMAVLNAVNERWSVDFMSDRLATGRRWRIFSIVDDCTRERVARIVDFSIRGTRLTRELDRLAHTRPLPKTLVCENGPEQICKAMFVWAERNGVKLHFIQPGTPTRNAFVESFNARFSEYGADFDGFASLEDARPTIDDRRTHYDHPTIEQSAIDGQYIADDVQQVFTVLWGGFFLVCGRRPQIVPPVPRCYSGMTARAGWTETPGHGSRSAKRDHGCGCTPA